MSRGRAVRRSERVFRLFARYAARYYRRHMHALRLAEWGKPPGVLTSGSGERRPLVVYSNHPSWWDAMVYILLADRLFPRRRAHAPMDAAMLRRYPIFRRLGAFAVEPDSPAGAAAFLEQARALLADPDCLLFVSAPGRFVDVRTRPQGVKAGIARVPELAPDALLVPLAIDFVFWDERKPEGLLAFGPAMEVSRLSALPRAERRAHLEAALHDTMDRLQRSAEARSPSDFASLLTSTAGVGGFYDLWARLRAGVSGRRYDPSHRGGFE